MGEWQKLSPSVLENRLKSIQKSTQRQPFHKYHYPSSRKAGSGVISWEVFWMLSQHRHFWYPWVFCGWFLWAEQDLFICYSPAQHGRIAGNMKNKQGILTALCHSGQPKHYRVAAKLGHLSKYFEWV